MKKLKARLGDKNQEHCTVYNMIRLAEFLFRQTKDPAYMHYIEYNVQNGIMAQTYCPEGGLLTYFLPMESCKQEGMGRRKRQFLLLSWNYGTGECCMEPSFVLSGR